MNSMARLAAQTTNEQCSVYLPGSTGLVVTEATNNSVTVTFLCSDPDLEGVFNLNFEPNFANWTSFEASFDDFTNGSQTFDGSFECSRPNSSSTDIDCTYSYSGLTGLDNGRFSISGSAFTGNNFSGYNGTLTVTDSDEGKFTITARNIIYDDSCTFDVPVNGSLTLKGSEDSEATVTFNDCNSATVMVDGDSILITWSEV